MTRVTKKSGLQASARFDESLAPLVRREAALRGSGVHSFATEVLGLVIECMQTTGMSWEEYRRTLPGFDKAIAARLAKVAAR